jgi:hypothetical protein
MPGRSLRAQDQSSFEVACTRRLVELGLKVEIRKLIREMSIANPLWGAPRIHGELLKLGVDIGQTSAAS